MSWCTYFRLLMWKNFMIKSRHKVELAVEIILPVVFLATLLGIRNAAFPTIYPQPTVYPQISIGVDSLDKLRLEYGPTVQLWEIDYTPNHPLLQTLISNAANQLRLGIKGFNSAADLVSHMTLQKSFVGIVFDVNPTSIGNTLPKNFTYRIKFPGELRTATVSSQITTWSTHNLFPTTMNSFGPRNSDSITGGNPGYIREGFMAIQNAISSSYIKIAANQTVVEIPEIRMQRFPYPPYVFYPLIESMKQSAGIMIVLAFMFPSVQFIKHITVEKQKQLKEAMKIMGLSTALHWAAWFVTMMIVLFVIVLVLMVLLRVPWFEDYTVGVFVNSSWSLLLITFLIYAMSCITFCFMFSSFFTKATIAGPISALAWFITYIPFAFTVNSPGFPFAGNVIISFFLNSALPTACSIIFSWEGTNEGAQWSNIFKYPPDATNFSLGIALIMMIADGILYLLITLYIEKTMPGAYGTAYKWYFPFTRSFWVGEEKYIEQDLPPSSPDGTDDRFECEIENKNEVGIRVINIRKNFGSKVAVDGLNMKMFENQITVLLGHNGAGKTTTISMITGLIPPTSGTAIVNGYDMRKDFVEIRKKLGFCPQYNILFDELTVEEHIRFYSQLKGVPQKLIEDEVNRYLKILELEDKRNAQSCTLSGGMKRKLSVGIALCGDSKFVLCDEPSAGMDPSARRALWQLLQTEKRGRTILLTTHLMDEADVLGDRIAVMAEGKLACSGTPFFLKKRFGTGYKLICSKQLTCYTKAVTGLIHEYIPEATIKSEVGMELVYELPERYSNVFGPMLNKLETAQDELGISGYGISMTTLEDVFLKTGIEVVENGMRKNGSDIVNGVAAIHVEPFNIDAVETVGPRERILYQWKGMFYKKFINFRRSWYLFAIQLIVPVIFVVLGWLISATVRVDNSLPSLEISLNGYGSTVTLLSNEATSGSLSAQIASNYIKIFEDLPRTEILEVLSQPVQETILLRQKANIWNVDRHYMVAATIGPNRCIGWFNNQGLHTAPLTLNLIYNAIARTILSNDYSITVINEPLPLSSNNELDKLKNSGGLGFQLGINTTFAMAYVTSIFIMFLISERVSRSKLLQMVSGVRLGIFWAAHFLWDFLIYLVVTCVIILVILLIQQDGFNTSKEIGQLFLVLVLYGFATLPVTYLVSFYFEEPATGLARLSLIQVLTGDALFVVAFILNAIGVSDTLQKVAIIFPNFALAQAISNQASLESTSKICNSISQQVRMSVEEICERVSSQCCNLDPFAWENPGIGKILVSMFGVGCGLFFILYLREKRSSRPSCCSRVPSLPQESQSDFDDDVRNEKDRIARLQAPEIMNKKFVAQDLTKYYNKFLAVSRLTLAVDRGECFGLLGVNGAGKTSAFKMMAGDEMISHGDVWVNGHSVKDDLSAIYEYIGYCPQYDALLLEFTGMEMLKLFATLRGIPKHYIEPLCEQLAVNLAFDRHLHKKIGDYSGGNRRKLSTAVALLGNPHVVYLDEPTAGIDPASRRKVWDMVCHFRDIGKAIILTSHSMEECEALCTRIAIMVNGEFKCIGSSQHLKNKYTPEKSLSIKLGKLNGSRISPETNIGDFERPAFQLDENGLMLFKFIIENLPGSKLKDYHKNLLTFELPGNTMKYSQIFSLIEANKDGLHIEDYSLSQGTLEQVFISFAKNQRDESKK